jgi:hypothetical protein
MDTAHLSAYYRGLGDALLGALGEGPSAYEAAAWEERSRWGIAYVVIGVAVTEASEAAIRFQVTDV